MRQTLREKRRCRNCQKVKTLAEFLRPSVPLGTTLCLVCRKEMRAAWRSTEAGRAANARYRRNWHIRQYGITPEQYEKLLEAQSGGCAICGSGPEPGKSLAIDHCHNSGKVRALLCTTCNAHLGVYESFRDKAESFLSRFGEGSPLIYGSDLDN